MAILTVASPTEHDPTAMPFLWRCNVHGPPDSENILAMRDRSAES